MIFFYLLIIFDILSKYNKSLRNIQIYTFEINNIILVKKLLLKTFKEIWFEFTMMVTFSTGVTAFYHCFIDIINRYVPHFNKHGLIYLFLTSFCILIPSIVEAIRTRKPNIFIKMTTEFIDRMMNIIGFTAMLVPTVLIINKSFGYVDLLGDYSIKGVLFSYFLSFLFFLLRTYLFHKRG